MYETKKFDIKTIIFIVIVIALILVAVFLIINFSFNSKNNLNNTTLLTSSDQKFTISMPNNIKYKTNSIPNNDFTIDLFSEKDNMFMYATTIEKSHDIDLYTVAIDDKNMYFKDKENIREDSRNFRD